MKVKVIIEFKDKYTGEIYPVNKILENITKKRYGEIKPYVELLKKDTFEERAKKSARRKG